MSKTDIFEPKQKRSIEKKNHIIKTGLALMVEKGYHHTTTDDIAAAAGVSTGIIYRYFKDKHDILLAGLKFAFQQMNEDKLFDITEDGGSSKDSIKNFVEMLLKRFIEVHINNKSMHEELEAMRHSDTEVAQIYDEAENAIIMKIVNELADRDDCEHTNLAERTYAVFNLIEGYCHMYMKNISSCINMECMKKVTVNSACRLLEKDITQM